MAQEMHPPLHLYCMLCSLYTMGGNVLGFFLGDKEVTVCREKFFTGKFCFQVSGLTLTILP